MCPAVGQGALAIETRHDGLEAQHVIQKLDHAASRIAVTAERALLATLEGGCQVPIGGHATVHGNEIHLRAIVASPDGLRVVRAEATGSDPRRVGEDLGHEMLDRGAREILKDVYAA
jgi:hydroxymethylbilane synthase